MIHQLSLFNYSVRNLSDDAIDIYIDGYIVDAPTQEMLKNWLGDETSVSYKSLRDQINQSSPKTVNIYINSGGGQVADAMAIHDLIVDLQNKGTNVNTIGRGIIASAATYILMASNNSEISENSWFMIHNCQGFAYGDVNDMENTVKTLRKFNNQVRDLYVNYTGLPAETISSYMNKETWFTGKEAEEKGFVKKATGSVSFKNSIKKDKWPFQNTAVLNSYNSFTNKKSGKMKINVEGLTTAIKNALKESGIIKDSVSGDDKRFTDACSGLSSAIVNAIKADETEAIKTAVANYIKENPITAKVDETAVQNAIAAELAKTGEGSVSEAISNAVANAVKGVPKAEDVTRLQAALNTLTEDVAKKLGNKSTEKDEDDETGKKGKSNKRSIYQVGNFIKSEVN
jgi:ATP-dependent Clp protease protease subunit